MANKKITSASASASTDSAAAAASDVAVAGAVDASASAAVSAIKKASKPRAKKAAATADASDVVTDATNATDATTDVAADVVPVTSTTTLDNILKSFTTLAGAFKDISLQLKNFQKEHNKLARSHKGGKRSNANANASGVKRKPSGFAKPAKLTDELCTFLNIPLGSEEPRTVVTSKLNTYIIENNLQRPLNRKFIDVNKDLKDLLKLEDGIELSYFNLQKHMKHLFVSNVVAIAPLAPEAAAITV